MPRWQQLEQDISRWLSTFASQQVEYRNSYQAIVGFPSDGFRSDGMVTNNSVLLAIEVEAGQTHPDTNTGKYWILYDKYKQYRKILLFHIYTPNYDSYGWRKKLAEFYICKMRREVPIEYFLLDYRDAQDYDSVLTNIKGKIAEKIAQEFGVNP